MSLYFGGSLPNKFNVSLSRALSNMHKLSLQIQPQDITGYNGELNFLYGTERDFLSQRACVQERSYFNPQHGFRTLPRSAYSFTARTNRGS